MSYAAARHNMVESQIRTNRVTDPAVIEVMSALPRELFVPPPLQGVAYMDEDVELGNDRVLMEPLVQARLLQLAEVKSSDVALDVGCGSGYSAAVLARLASVVVAVECDPALAEQARRNLAELAIDNASVVTGPLVEGHAAQAPYDVIVVSGAVPEVPKGLCEQLAEGGRLVCIVSGEAGVGRGILVTRVGSTFGRRDAFDAGTRPLPGFARAPGFVF